MKKWIFRIWGKAILFLFGWKVDLANRNEAQRCVMVAAPHTSNWDFVFARAAFEILEIPVRFTIKREWTKGLLGKLLISLGAIGIDRRGKDARDQPISYVDAMARLFEQEQRLAILVTPEGTRKRNENWKSGFYYVAKQAGVPIALGYLDYKTKTAGVGAVIWPSDDMEADMRKIMAFYQKPRPKFPENFSIDTRYKP